MNILIDLPLSVKPVTDFEVTAAAQVEHDDDYRPTAGSDFLPSVEDEAENIDFLTTQEERDAVMVEWAAADRAEAMEAAFGDPWDIIAYEELAECGGFHPSARYED